MESLQKRKAIQTDSKKTNEASNKAQMKAQPEKRLTNAYLPKSNLTTA